MEAQCGGMGQIGKSMLDAVYSWTQTRSPFYSVWFTGEVVEVE